MAEQDTIVESTGTVKTTTKIVAVEITKNGGKWRLSMPCVQRHELPGGLVVETQTAAISCDVQDIVSSEFVDAFTAFMDVCKKIKNGKISIAKA